MALPARAPLSPEQSRYFEHSLDVTSPALPLGIAELDAILPDGGLPCGAVVELAVGSGSALATSIALGACRAAQQRRLRDAGQASWCAFVDPTATLHGPGIAEAGVLIERLLVVRPPVEALSRVVTRLAEARIFDVLVIDTMGIPGCPLQTSLGDWPRIVRRLTLGIEGTDTSVVMITDHHARRPLPLPVALRLELSRSDERHLQVRVAKDKRGRISSPKSIVWTRSRSKPLKVTERERG